MVDFDGDNLFMLLNEFIGLNPNDDQFKLMQRSYLYMLKSYDGGFDIMLKSMNEEQRGIIREFMTSLITGLVSNTQGVTETQKAYILVTGHTEEANMMILTAFICGIGVAAREELR